MQAIPLERVLAALTAEQRKEREQLLRKLDCERAALHDLEAVPRDVYCGAIGWVAPGGTMRFSVAIRTISLFADGEAVYNVGGGVVFDSTADEEYRECLLKARFATGTVQTSS